MPPYDATTVTRLEAAGAVLLGKLNCDEFAMGSSNENSAYGRCANPRALDRVPGGSSGGSAAAVAAGFAVASLGSDTGGSIRQPAGLLRRGRRAAHLRARLPFWPHRLRLVAGPRGPFATNVRDAATMLGVIAGQDAKDATSSDRPSGDYAGALAKPVAGLRIGVPAEYFGEGLDPEIRAAIERALDGLRNAGCEIGTWRCRAPGTPSRPLVIARAEASANLSRFDGVRFGLRAAAENAAQDALCHVPRDARPGLRRRGEEPHPARHGRASATLQTSPVPVETPEVAETLAPALVEPPPVAERNLRQFRLKKRKRRRLRLSWSLRRAAAQAQEEDIPVARAGRDRIEVELLPENGFLDEPTSTRWAEEKFNSSLVKELRRKLTGRTAGAPPCRTGGGGCPRWGQQAGCRGGPGEGDGGRSQPVAKPPENPDDR